VIRGVSNPLGTPQSPLASLEPLVHSVYVAVATHDDRAPPPTSKRPVGSERAMSRPIGLLLLALLAAIALGRRASAQESGPLLVGLQLDRRIYEPGAPIVFHVILQNATNAPVTVVFPTSQRFDVVLRSPLGVVGRWSAGIVFAQAISRQTWGPGEVVAFSEAWIPRTELTPALIGGGETTVARGLFTVQAELTGLTLKPVSRPELIVIGTPVLLDAGCTTLLDTPSADTPIGMMTFVIEPLNALQSLWQPPILANGVYTAYAPGIAAVNNMQMVRRNVPLTVCLQTPARITLP
jgi:Intracellular proteinase inhibitor